MTRTRQDALTGNRLGPLTDRELEGEHATRAATLERSRNDASMMCIRMPGEAIEDLSDGKVLVTRRVAQSRASDTETIGRRP